MTFHEAQQIAQSIANLRLQLLDVAAKAPSLTDPQVLVCSQALDDAIQAWYHGHFCHDSTPVRPLPEVKVQLDYSISLPKLSPIRVRGGRAHRRATETVPQHEARTASTKSDPE